MSPFVYLASASPRRQELLAQYADQKYAGKRRDKTPRSPRFAATVRQGPGGTLLSADSDGVETLSAVSARKIDDARRHIGTLLPAAATSSACKGSSSPANPWPSA